MDPRFVFLWLRTPGSQGATLEALTSLPSLVLETFSCSHWGWLTWLTPWIPVVKSMPNTCRICYTLIGGLCNTNNWGGTLVSVYPRSQQNMSSHSTSFNYSSSEFTQRITIAMFHWGMRLALFQGDLSIAAKCNQQRWGLPAQVPRKKYVYRGCGTRKLTPPIPLTQWSEAVLRYRSVLASSSWL